jgi:hypothetical protein
MVVDLHGGHVAVKSQEGEGTRITVRLPITPPPRIEAMSPPEATSASPAETQRIEHHADH